MKGTRWQELPVQRTRGSATHTTRRNTEYQRNSIPRRGVLAAGAALSITGCVGMFSDDEEPPVVPDLPRVEDPPDGVYLPTHQESMEVYPTVSDGDISVTPMITYLHRFWTVTGNQAEEVLPAQQRGVHLMFTLWDTATEHVLPLDGGAEVRIFDGDDEIEQFVPWPMLSQTMGFHFGDNVPLPADGSYRVEIDLFPVESRRTGAFSDRFTELARVSFEFEYSESLRASLIDEIHYLDEDLWGQRGAIDLSDHDHHEHDHHDHESGHQHPISQLPEPGAYPGLSLGTPTSGDAIIVVQWLDQSESPTGAPYLLVSPRTPYNRIPLPDMAMDVSGDISGELVQTLDDEVGHHYGIDASLEPGDSVEITFSAPPQVSRHAGYETAFLEMPPVEVSVPE